MAVRKEPKIEEFKLEPGRVIAGKYEVLGLLGKGWEGEVYQIREKTTGIERTAKLFFPHRNNKNKAINIYATKLHKLRDCPSVIHYHHQEFMYFRKHMISVLISEYVEGLLLSKYLESSKGRRLGVFQAVHLLYAIVCALETIHNKGEYHGDLHSDNIIIRHHGLSYDLKILDFYNWGRTTRETRQDDICNAIYTLYEVLGGSKYYRNQPKEIKSICLGLKRSLIIKKFKDISALKLYLETMSWNSI